MNTAQPTVWTGTVSDEQQANHIVVGKKAPEVCPVCNHPQSYFQIEAQSISHAKSLC